MTEYAWVIERGNSPINEPEYWTGIGWSKDNLRAIRFARKVDADRALSGFDEDDPLPGQPEHRVAEHGWS